MKNKIVLASFCAVSFASLAENSSTSLNTSALLFLARAAPNLFKGYVFPLLRVRHLASLNTGD
ncbi:MAG: hypothetical protein HQM08_30170 [Candidatus Riflebacteria bacterium]|nr:hypothetical protein [Candidatus Riflebacteria bacterium]